MGKCFFGAKGPMPAFAAAGAGFAAPREEQKNNWHLANRSGYSSSRRNSSGAQGASGASTRRRGITRRALIAMILLVLLPPAGIAMMWYMGIFQPRGRVLLTVIGMVIMTVMFGFVMPEDAVVQVQPQAVKATLRSPLPTDAALNALSNMEELLAGVENVPVENTDLIEDSGKTVAEELTEATAEPTDPMQEVVYCVTVDAVYYHVASECKGQVNRRSLTVGQALAEGLKPCGRCDPPSF